MHAILASPSPSPRVSKSKNFLDNMTFHAKTFRITRKKHDVFDFATNVRKTRQFHVFLGNVRMYRNYQTMFCLVNL